MSSRESHEREEKLIAYLYGELSPEENEAVARQIAADSSWADDWKTLQSTVGVLRRWEDAEPPVRHPAAVTTARSSAPLDRASRVSRPAVLRSKRNWSRWAGWSVAAAAILLLITQTEVSREDGALTVRFGKAAYDRMPVMTSTGTGTPLSAQGGVSLVRPVGAPVSSYITKEEFLQSQEELIRFLATLVRESEDRQMTRWASAFENYAKSLELQHEADLGVMSERVGEMERSAQSLIRGMSTREGTKEESGR